MLCVCINDSDPLPEEAAATGASVVAADDGTPMSKSSGSIDRDIQSIKSDPKSEVSSLSSRSTAATAAAALDCFKEGKHAQEAEDYTQAISFYKRAVELNPKFVEAHSNLAEVFALCKNAPAAEKHFIIVAELDPFSYKTLYKLGYLYLNDLNQPESAAEIFKKCIDISPSDPDALVSLGLSYMETERHADAIKCFKDLLSDNPKDVVARFNLGNAYLDSGAYTEAVAEYMKVLELKKTHVDASFNMAIAYQHMAKSDNISTETRLRYLSCAMRVYVQISSWKDSISRQFVVEALKGVESVRREQTKYTNSQVADNTGASDTISARSRSGSSAPPPAASSKSDEDIATSAAAAHTTSDVATKGDPITVSEPEPADEKATHDN